MSGQVDIERIVREVLQRLQAVASAAAPVAPQSNRLPTAPNSLAIADRLITLAALEGKLSGVKLLTVQPRAIVTPAVRDELKKRGISLQRGDLATISGATAAVRLLALAVDCEKAEKASRSAIDQVGGVEWLAAHATNSLVAAVGELAKHSLNRQLPALLLTTKPLTAVVAANRDRRIRAAVVRDARSLDEALNAIGANFVVVDPSRASPFLLRTITQRLASAVIICPPELAAS